MSLTLLIAGAGVAVVSYMAVRDHRAAIRARHSLLDDCKGAFDHAELSRGADGFPQISGPHRGRWVQAQLLLDTLTMRRLPQLWLSTTLLERNPGLPGMAILVRHNGSEFYSLTSHFDHRIDTPLGLPQEVVIRGEPGAATLLAKLTPMVSDILGDARVKEIAITDRGLRIVRQACEGKRGDHLLLRQSVFENAQVPRADLTRILDQLSSMSAIVNAHQRTQAAA
ncbi:MAG: hypothetical protein WC829_05085 [Hyphomicrobium sp.]|jgi:hypothetical protein